MQKIRWLDKLVDELAKENLWIKFAGVMIICIYTRIIQRKSVFANMFFKNKPA